MKKVIITLLMVLVTFSLFAQGARESERVNETFIFVDDLGREVELPTKITRVAPSGSLASAFLVSFDPSLFVGLTTKASSEEIEFFGKEFGSLPVLGTFYGKKANLNKEALIVQSPEVVIDIGEIKGSISDMIKDLDKLSNDIQIPVIFIKSYLSDIDHTYTRLGEALNNEERGSALASFSREALEFASRIKSSSTGATFYYATDTSGLNAIPKGNFHGEVLEAIGGVNAVSTTISDGKNQISLEELYKCDIQNIIVLEESAYNTILNSKEWSFINAVGDKKVYKVPHVLFPLIDAPPAVNRIIGLYWAASKIYPSLNDVSFIDKAKEFYKLFFNHELTSLELAELSR